MSRETENNLSKIENGYYETIIPLIFGKEHKHIKTFDDFKNSVKYGKVTLNIAYSSKLAKELLPANNFGFFNGISIIKNLGGIIFITYVLIAHKDYNFLLVLPTAFILNLIILYFWHNRLITFLILIISTIAITTYFELSIYYKIFLIGYCLLKSIAFSAYSSFLNQYFSQDEITFDTGLEHKLILQIYDSYTKTLFRN